MRWINTLRLRLSTFFRRSQAERDLDAELQFHLEQQREENLAAGMSRQEARHEAQRVFGSVGSLKEQARDTWGIGFVETLRQDLRFAWRSFRRNPGFTATILVTLGLGIGVGTAIFSIVNAVLLQPLPYRDSHRLVALARNSSGQPSIYSMGAGEFLARRELSTTLQSMAAFRYGTWRIESGQDRRVVSGLQVSEGFFDVLGVEPALGRRFFSEDHRPGADLAVVLMDGIWRTQFNADTAVIGKRYQFWNISATIVGVMPPGFVFAKREADYLTPVDLGRYKDRPFRYTYFGSIGRLEDGVSIEQAQAEHDVLSDQFRQQHPEYEDARQTDLVALSEASAGEVRPALTALFVAVAFVMLIVCANVANLLLGRALARRREIGIRAAIGAGRARLVRQLLTESLILSIAGGAIGFGLAQLIVGQFQALAPDRGGWGSFLIFDAVIQGNLGPLRQTFRTQ